jgi:hypothetical protein
VLQQLVLLLLPLVLLLCQPVDGAAASASAV